MRTSLRALVLAGVAGLLLLLGVAVPPVANAAAAPTHYYSFTSYADGRALAVHTFYPSLSTAVAETYDGSSRMQWGLKSRAAAADALLVSRSTGACLTASGGYAVLATCTNAVTQGWTFVYPSGPDHIEAPYGLRNTATQLVLTVGPNNWAGTPMELKPDYGFASQRFWLDWRYTG